MATGIRERRRWLSAALWACACLWIGGVGCGRGGEGEAVTFAGLLGEMGDVAGFAMPPRGRAALISTYDRTGGNSDWGNLADRGADGLVTIADLEGPGCVKRIWMTNVPAREWLFFFDGEKEPRFRGRAPDLFGGEFPFMRPLCDNVSGGFYVYLPLPYAKRLRIALLVPKLSPGSRPYYQVHYETYEKGTRVETFPGGANLTAADRDAVEQACRAWREVRGAAAACAASCTQAERAVVGAGETWRWLEREGAGTVRAFTARIVTRDASAVRRAQRMRELVLRMGWDGSGDASVEVPLGDFFCNGAGPRRFASLPLAEIDGRWVCRFPMPYRAGAFGEVRNDGTDPVELEMAADVVDTEPAAGSRYFHAGWTAADSAGVPMQILRASGSGHYVGLYLTAYGRDGTWKILEGDEAFWVDGETIPSLHGTGLEDYFNGAWYYGGLFDLPQHGLLEKAAMRTTQYRFHRSDPIGFELGLQMNFEFGEANAARGTMTGTAYWYQDAVAAAGTRLPPAGQRGAGAAPDPVEKAAVMTGLQLFEREGLWAEARERCGYYAEQMGGTVEGYILRVRQAAYGEMLGETGQAMEQVSALAEAAGDSPLAEQPRMLLWYHEAASNALLGAHINGRYVAYVDGRRVGEGDSPVHLSVWKVPLEPGDHELAFEVTPTRPDPWLSAYLRAHGTNVVSGWAWECSRERPADWPAPGGVRTGGFGRRVGT